MAANILQQVTSRLQQLTIHGVQSRSTFQVCQRWIQTTSVCQRSLDNRRLPIYRFPGNKNGRWEPRKKMTEMYEYTVRPLPFPNTGGRGPNGRIWNYRRSGGHKKNFRMIAWHRGGSAVEGKPELEKVDGIHYDPNRSGRIAMVASGERKRWVMATENMKKGDIIKCSMHLSQTPVRAQEGDTYPLGSLPVGTLVNCVEQFPGHGGYYARAAGVTAQLVRKMGDTCLVRLPSKREIQVSVMCQATVGRISNVDHNKRVIGKAGRNRWLGFKPRSGKWHRKEGRHGRKIKPMKGPIVFNKPRSPPNARIYTLPKSGVNMRPSFQPGFYQT